MAISQMLRRSLSSERRLASSGAEVPMGHFVVYVGKNEKSKFVIPVSFFNHSSFQELLYQAEKEFCSIIQWMASPFLAVKIYSLISSPTTTCPLSRCTTRFFDRVYIYTTHIWNSTSNKSSNYSASQVSLISHY
ncbi:hypothetical protein ACS0TY_003886 [Phlomoides rotata]